MKTGFFCLCLVAAFALSTESAKAQQQQQQQPGIQPSQPQQQQQQQQPQQQHQQEPQQEHQQQQMQGQQQQGQYQQQGQQQGYQGQAPIVFMGNGLDPLMLQGQWETKCVPAVPGQWLIPSSILPYSPDNCQRAIYTFVGHTIVFQINEYRSPFGGPGDLVATPFSKNGTWEYIRPFPTQEGVAEVDMYFKYCTAGFCTPNDPNVRLYSQQSQVLQFRGLNPYSPTQLFIGAEEGANVHWFFHDPLYKPGFAPEDPR